MCVVFSDPGHQCGDRRQQREEISQRRSAAVVSDEDCRVRLSQLVTTPEASTLCESLRLNNITSSLSETVQQQHQPSDLNLSDLTLAPS